MRSFWDAYTVLINTEYRKMAQTYWFLTGIRMAKFCNEQNALLPTTY